MKKIIPLFLLLAACTTPGATPGQTTTSNTGSSVIVQSLTPLCASTLRDRNLIPQQARNLGIDETAVCDCSLRKAEAKVAANPALLIDVFRSTDAQIKLLVDVGGQCSAELLTRALTGQISPSPSPYPGSPYATPTPYSPYPYPTPSAAPTFWPPTGP